ncbi:uncharacterized protein METZ01_LOCUS503201, partial [marine metagenome]
VSIVNRHPQCGSFAEDGRAKPLERHFPLSFYQTSDGFAIKIGAKDYRGYKECLSIWHRVSVG